MNIQKMVSLSCLGLCSTAFFSNLTAAELILHDARLGFETLPLDFDFDITHPTITVPSGSTAFKSGYGLNASYLHAFTDAGDDKGFYIGAEAQYGLYALGGDGDAAVISLRGLGGYGWQISDSWALTGEVFGGISQNNMTFPTTTAFNSFDADGTGLGYGARIGANYNISENWLASLMVGYSQITTDLDGSTGDFELHMEQSGIGFMLGISWRVSALPSRLEE